MTFYRFYRDCVRAAGTSNYRLTEWIFASLQLDAGRCRLNRVSLVAQRVVPFSARRQLPGSGYGSLPRWFWKSSGRSPDQREDAR